MIKSSYRVDRALFSFSKLVLIIRIENKLYKKEFMSKVLTQIHQILKLVEKVIHIFFI